MNKRIRKKQLELSRRFSKEEIRRYIPEAARDAKMWNKMTQDVLARTHGLKTGWKFAN